MRAGLAHDRKKAGAQLFDGPAGSESGRGIDTDAGGCEGREGTGTALAGDQGGDAKSAEH
jgi:hypothetical protein